MTPAIGLKFHHYSHFLPSGQWLLKTPTKKHTVSWENVHVNTLVVSQCRDGAGTQDPS